MSRVLRLPPRCSKIVRIKGFRNPPGASVATDARYDRSTAHQKFVAQKHMVGVLDTCPPNRSRIRPDPQQVVVPSRAEILNFQFGDDEHRALLFEVAIRAAGSSQKLGSTLLKVRNEIRVMHTALAIGFLITDADFDFMRSECGHAGEFSTPRRHRRGLIVAG
jgi:hypothetical protein